MSKNTGCFLSEWQTNRSRFLPVAVSVGTGTSAWTEMCPYKPAFPHIFRWPHETTRKIWKSRFYNNISYLSWHLNHIVQFRDWESAMLSDFFLQISFSKFHIIHKISKIYFYEVYYGQNTECKNTKTRILSLILQLPFLYQIYPFDKSKPVLFLVWWLLFCHLLQVAKMMCLLLCSKDQNK